MTPTTVLVLRNAGPNGAPGMPEAGYLPIPKKLGAQGVKDMVRISDARMSGTAFGTIVLHVTPEAAVGGPLALVRDGDRIRLDATARKLDLLVSDAELARRRAQWKPPQSARARLRQALRGARDAGRPGLRLRFPGGDVMVIGFSVSFRDAGAARGPGIHVEFPCCWIPGSRLRRAPE